MRYWGLFFLFFLFTKTTIAATDTIQVFSKAMQKDIKVVVVTPEKLKKKILLPTVYLLHGYGGNYAQWVSHAPQLQARANELKMILVCPDGGYNSWYLNSPVDSTVRYESFCSQELVEYIDEQYPTIKNKQFRAITGLSMGGHGALYLAIKHTNVFGNAGSICGGVDIRPFPKSWDLVKKLGDTICCKQNWEEHTVINVTNRLKNKELNLIIDCGVDDFFLSVNRNLHQKLLQMKIEHDYTERPGGHNKAYWSNAINYQLYFFGMQFAKNKEQLAN